MEAVLLIAVTIAAITDYCNGKIPNFITIPLIVIGAVWQICTSGGAYLLMLLVIFYMLCSFPGIGMGDLKLIFGIAICTNPHILFKFLVISHLAAVIVWLGNFFLTKQKLKGLCMGPFFTTLIFCL